MNARTIRCLISAGPTREYFDPVRFLSNPSTGKMGFAIAEAARDAGWDVSLVSGPVALVDPKGVAVCRVNTGAEMFAALEERFDSCHVLIMTAAVTDWKPKTCLAQKAKKDQLAAVVQMEPVVDILKTLSRRKTHQLLVGFAAETENVEAYARKKLQEKNCDFIVANQVGVAGSGFASDDNQVQLIPSNGDVRRLGPASKKEIARELVQVFAQSLG